MHGVRDGDESAFPLCHLLWRALASYNQINPLVLSVILCDNPGFVASPSGIMYVVNGWVGEIKPHGCVKNVPTGEVAVGDWVFCTRTFNANFKIIARVRIDCR